MQYRDIIYALGVYHKNGLTLTNTLVKSGHKAIKNFEENKEDRSFKVRANVLIAPSTLKNIIKNELYEEYNFRGQITRDSYNFLLVSPPI